MKIKKIYILLGIALFSFIAPSPVHAKNEIYRWQIGDYRAISQKHADEIQNTQNLDQVPKELNDRYMWQLKEYPAVRRNFQDEIHDIMNRPPTPEEVNDAPSSATHK